MLQCAALEAAMEKTSCRGLRSNQQSRAHIAVATLLNMSLEKDAVKLTSADFLLEFDLAQREL